MGIYDREYYRRDGPSFLGSLAEEGAICKWLVGINIVCFILQMVTRTQVAPFGEDGPVFWREPFTNALLLNVQDVMNGQIWRLLTYAFLHDTSSIWHIVFNMLILYFFGRQVEAVLGPREFLIFYLCGAVLSGLTYVLCSLAGWGGGSALGASGAVMAVLVLAALYNPRQIIYLFFLIPVPIWGVVVFMVVADAFHLLGNSGKNVANSAHLGGAAFGFLYYRLGWRLSRVLPTLSGRQRITRVKPRLRLYREEEDAPTPVEHPQPRPADLSMDDDQLEAQMDAILAKIPRVGLEGLTPSEREVLVRASEAIKRRRG